MHTITSLQNTPSFCNFLFEQWRHFYFIAHSSLIIQLIRIFGQCSTLSGLYEPQTFSKRTVTPIQCAFLVQCKSHVGQNVNFTIQNADRWPSLAHRDNFDGCLFSRHWHFRTTLQCHKATDLVLLYISKEPFSCRLTRNRYTHQFCNSLQTWFTFLLHGLQSQWFW